MFSPSRAPENFSGESLRLRRYVSLIEEEQSLDYTLRITADNWSLSVSKRAPPSVHFSSCGCLEISLFTES